MSGRLILPDTNILILASQGKFDLTSLFGPYDDVLISVVSVAEALGFNFTDVVEEALLNDYFRDLTVLPFTEAEARFVIAYRKARRRIGLFGQWSARFWLKSWRARRCWWGKNR